MDAANATATRREQDARHEAASALRARDRAESDLRATSRDLSRAKDDLRELSRAKDDAARAKDDAAAARAELASTRATLEAALTEARDVARTLHARLLQAPQQAPQQQAQGSWNMPAAAPQAPQGYAPQGQQAYGGGGGYIAAAAAQQATAQGGGSSLFSHGGYQAQEPYFEAGAKRPYDAIAPQPQQQQQWGAQPVQPPQQQQQPSWADWQAAETKRMRGNGY